MAWRVITEKKHSTRLSQEHPVDVKCRLIRGFFSSQASREPVSEGIPGLPSWPDKPA
jgi:hypothetical protein